MKIIAIVGSREFPRTAYGLIQDFINTLSSDTMIISGGARGVDQFAITMATARGFRTKVYEANWDQYGTRAGFLRNSQLVAVADEIVVFRNGFSKGSADIMTKARQTGKPLTVIKPD